MFAKQSFFTALLSAVSIFPVTCFAQAPVKIGVMLCLTGDCAEWGTNGLRGAELAIEELNQSSSGSAFELAVQDSRDTTPAAAVSAFRKLEQDPAVHFIVGPTWTVGGMPVAPLVARRKDIIMISPSVGVKEFNEYAENIFNVWPHDEVATRAIARYAADKGWRKAAIFGSQDPFYMTQTKIFEEEFTALGGKIVEKVEPLPNSRELRAEALRIKSSAPDFVIFTNYQADVIAKELRFVQMEAPLAAIQMEKERVKAAEGALEGTVFAMYEKPEESFTERFKKKFGAEPGISADTAYDAVLLIASAIKKTKDSDPAKVRAELLQTRNYRGASGTFSIDEKGAVDKKPVLWRVSGLDYARVE